MAETHVVSALRAKRAEIAGHIHDLEKKLARYRANLASVDATIRIFSPELDPDAIPSKRTYRRTRYFAKGELARRILGETEASVTNKLKRGTFPATWFLAVLAALELDGVALEEI